MKNSDSKELSPGKTAQVLKLSLEGSAKDFVKKWNDYNPAYPVDIRFVLNKSKTGKLGKVKAQATLTMELKVDFTWQVMARKILNFRSVAEMERSEDLLTLGLWSDMFAEIAHMGFIGGINLAQNKTDHDHNNPDRQEESSDQASTPAHRQSNETA